jgi:hypothetical protein
MSSKTAAERAHLNAVGSLPCIVCRRLRLGESPAEVHHIREGQGRRRASDLETIPLCYPHHRGQDGIHHIGTKAWHRRFWPERELLQEVLSDLGVAPEDSASRAR